MGKKHIPLTGTLPCPCGAVDEKGKNVTFAACCQPLLMQQQSAVTAAQLMRSRYTAYVLNQIAYLQKTWHPDTCPSDLTVTSTIKWVSLRLLSATQTGANTAEVCFIARYKDNGRAGKLQECSRFTKLNGVWVYVDGDIK